MSKRLCMVVHGPFPPDARVAREAVAAVVAGYEVDVVAMSREGQPRRERVDGVNVIRLPLSRHRGAGPATVVYEYAAFTMLATLTVARLAVTRRYRVVQVHNPPDFLMLATVLPRLLGSRALLDIHDFSADMLMMRFGGRRWSRAVDRVLHRIERLAAAAADAIITVHEPYREALVERGIDPEKVTVVMNSLDERLLPDDDVPAMDDRLRVVYHGTVTPHYGVVLLVEAVARARRDLPEITLEIYGEGDALGAVRARVAELDIDSIVTIANEYLPQREVLGRVRGASVGVVPNLPIRINHFALSSKLLEYVALGVPAVCADLPTLRAHFSSDEVLFFAAGNVEALAASLSESLSDRAAARRRAEAARARYEEYRWAVQSKRYVDVLDTLTAR
jgi:glycosyltransferase involved in cell wall biosynthesis